MSLETRAHTALHIVKGAIVKVLGEDAKWSAGANVNGGHGRITVQYNRKPTEDEVNEIERLANEKIKENAVIEIHEMSRVDAEARWGDWIYDLFPLPESITELQVFHLPDWNVNACNKLHTETTGEIGKVSISKWRFRKNKQLLEVSYDIE
ncbi:MAG: alanyl-tRNA editing protein [Candidatus Bathyarchaeota archaeon]|nr:alanyl-tRNA editing protein [Candidatus Bathyarchaeota archaeon]